MRLKHLFIVVLVASCGKSLEGPTPSVTGVTSPTPPVVCNEQLVTPVVIAGEALAPIVEDSLTGPKAVLPAITLVHPDGTRTTVPDTDDPDTDEVEDQVDWQSQGQMTFVVDPELELAPGTYAIEVCNRPTLPTAEQQAQDAGTGVCVTQEQALVVVPRPEVTDTQPDLVCTEDGENTVTLTGTDFLDVEGTMPEVTVGDVVFSNNPEGDEVQSTIAVVPETCESLGGPAPDVMRCTSLTFTVPIGTLMPNAERTEPLTHNVTVTNPAPAACVSKPSDETIPQIDLTVVPPPSVDSVVPDLICTDEGDNVITVNGVDFLSIDDGGVLLPTVTVGDVDYPAATIDDCVTLDGPDITVRRCDTLTFTVPVDDLEPGNYDVYVTNPVPGTDPAPAPCTSNTPVTLTVVPPPTVTSAVPDLACDKTGSTDVGVTVTGTGFLTVDDGTTLSTPTVNVGTDQFASTASNCTNLPGDPDLNNTVQTCTTLSFTITADSVALAGLQTLSVTNPPTAACTSNDAAFLVDDGPTITGLDVPSACEGFVPAQLTVQGTFLVVDGVEPTVTFDGTLTTSTATGCTDVAGPGTQPDDLVEDVNVCTGLLIDVPNPASLTNAMSPYPIVVTSSLPGACSDTIDFNVAVVPVISDVIPKDLCEGVDNTITVIGTGFNSGSQVLLDAVSATNVNYIDDPGPTDRLVADFGPLPDGSYTLTVSNGPNCFDTFGPPITVHPTPIAFFVDPPVVYNGINTQVTVWVTNINCDPDNPSNCVDFVGISLNGSGDPPTQLFQLDGVSEPVYEAPNKIKPVIPIGTPASTPIGDPGYDVYLTDGLGCVAQVLPNGLEVTDTTTMELTSVSPPFGWTDSVQGTAVSVTTDTSGAYDEFIPTPRVYLNPTTTTAAAAPLNAVAFVNNGLLTAVVPGQGKLDPDAYEVIVVNPDGTVGVSSQATTVPPFFFDVTAAPPPVIANLTPGSITTNDDQTVFVLGQDFDLLAEPIVEIQCRPPGGVPGPFELVNVVPPTAADMIELDIDSSTLGLTDGTVCIVRVTNPTDGSFGTFSAISVTNPSRNIQDFDDTGQDMAVARRAPAVFAGRATTAARFLYAVGGDDGTAAGAMPSIETASVDEFGVLSSWRQLDNLPGPRTFAGAATLGRFAYLVGGNNGSATMDTVWRAEILTPGLSPGRQPEIFDLDFVIDQPSGVTPGQWNYKVSAIFPPTDNDNPNGESLPSDVFVVRAPDSPVVHITLIWTPVPGASEYRIYRSTAINQVTGGERLLDTVTAAAACAADCSYADVGLDNTGEIQAPRQIGDVGEWSQVGTLTTPREGLGVSIAPDPDSGDYFIYAIAGMDDTGALLDDYEYATITVDVNGSQTVGPFAQDVANFLSSARWQSGVYTMDNDLAAAIPLGDTYVYSIGGCTTADCGTVTNVAEAALVQADGTLGVWNSVDAVSGNRAGFGAIGANDFMFTFGGTGAVPANDIKSAAICNAGGGNCEGPAPELANWNNDPALMVCGRYLMGFARESAKIFMVGGAATAPCTSPTNTTESVTW